MLALREQGRQLDTANSLVANAIGAWGVGVTVGAGFGAGERAVRLELQHLVAISGVGRQRHGLDTKGPHRRGTDRRKLGALAGQVRAGRASETRQHVGRCVGDVVAVARRRVGHGAGVAATHVVARGHAAVGIVVAKNGKTIEGPAQRVGVPIVIGLARHQTRWGGVVVVIIGTAGMAIAHIELALHLGVAVLATALFAGVEDGYAVDGHTDRPVVRGGGGRGDGGLEWNLPGVGAVEVLSDRHLQVAGNDAVHHGVGGQTTGCHIGVGAVAFHGGHTGGRCFERTGHPGTRFAWGVRGCSCRSHGRCGSHTTDHSLVCWRRRWWRVCVDVLTRPGVVQAQACSTQRDRRHRAQEFRTRHRRALGQHRRARQRIHREGVALFARALGTRRLVGGSGSIAAGTQRANAVAVSAELARGSGYAVKHPVVFGGAIGWHRAHEQGKFLGALGWIGPRERGGRACAVAGVGISQDAIRTGFARHGKRGCPGGHGVQWCDAAERQGGGDQGQQGGAGNRWFHGQTTGGLGNRQQAVHRFTGP